MADYNKWTKDDLIKRVKHLEAKLMNTSQNGASPIPPAPTSPARGPVEPPPTPPNLQNGGSETTRTFHQPGPKKPKAKKTMDPSKWGTRFIALKLAYIGKRYNGFEYQSSGALSTIEEELWKALVKACLIFPNPEKPNEVDWTVCDYSKCGRTDRGVSAFGQVVALRVRTNKPAKRKAAPATAAGNGDETTTMDRPVQNGKDGAMTEGAEIAQEEDDADDTPLPIDQEIQYCRALNRILPADIRVYAWCANPPPGFSARFSCRERQYRYFFTQPAYAPLPNFLEDPPTSTTITKPKDGFLDIAAMRAAAKHFEGLHDFRNFCKIDPTKQITNFQRRVFEADVVEVDGADSTVPYLSSPQFRDSNFSTVISSAGAQPNVKVYYFHVRGSAFLWHQIRCMVAILFLVGQGHESPDVITQLLDADTNPRRPSYVLADDAPLVLWECLFGRQNGDGAADEVDWSYVGGPGDSAVNLHGSNGLAGDLWEFWRERKMDELLANQMLDWLSRKTSMEREGTPLDAAEKKRMLGKGQAVKSSRVYDGGNSGKLSGVWVPVMDKVRMASAEEMNDKWAVRKGFKNAEEMRALGNWRDAIREAKEKEKDKGAAADAAEE